MTLAKLKPDDARVTYHYVTVNGRRYHYRLAEPSGGRAPRATILLVHGFPDLGFGWRNQVPMLSEDMGLRVIVPDALGYGKPDAPAEIEPYGHKSLSADLVALVDSVGVVGDDDMGDDDVADKATQSGEQSHGRFFIGGHDWGGALVWRMTLWHPDRIRGVFSVCTPYFPPTSEPFCPIADRVKALPNFHYQLQFAGDELWKYLEGNPTRIRQALNCLYADDVPGNSHYPESYKPGHYFNTAEGIVLSKLHEVKPSALLSSEEMDFYVTEFMRHGFRGPTNWYRVWKINYDDELELVQKNGGAPVRIATPALMVPSLNDKALPVELTETMPPLFDDLTITTVPGSHWVLWTSSEVVNAGIKDFLEKQLSPLKASK